VNARAVLLAPALLGALLAQTAPPAPALPELGPAAPVPDGAPPHLARIDRAGLREHAYWLADDARAGRYTSSPAQAATAQYVADHFKKLGLKPLGDQKGYLQRYPLRRTWLEDAVLTIGTVRIERDLAVFAGAETKVQLAGRVVHCGNGAPAAVPPGLAGRIPVVVLAGAATGDAAGNDLQALQRFTDVARQLAKQGASAGVVCVLGDKGSFANTLNYRAVMPDHPQLQYGSDRGRAVVLDLPLVLLSAAASAPLLAAMGLDATGAGTAADQLSGKLSLVVRGDDKAVGTNVCAVLEGTSRKQQAIVISAHHDHIGRRLDGDVFNGADDNASGTAGLLELAEAFAKGGPRPARSIVFLSVSGEELGLWGSDWYAEHPTWPLERIVANVNIDMIGRAGGADGTPIQMQVTPSHQHEKYSTLVRDAFRLATRTNVALTSGDTYYHRSDHFNFAKRGVPVVFFCDGEHPDYHQVTDTADRLDYPKMEAVARLAFWTAWNAAQAKGRPEELGAQPQW
jgi:hypothetical protein